MTEKSVLPPLVEGKQLEPDQFLLVTDCCEQSSLSSSFDPRNLKERILKGYRMKIRKGTKRTTLHKFLMAKMLLDEGGLHLEEYICLFELHFDLLSSNDPTFIEKNQKYLEKSGILLSQANKVRSFPLIIKNRPDDDALRFWGLPTRREYFGLKGQRDLRSSFKLILEDSLVPPSIPPQRYIGVGYKDKGTCRKPEEDGNQSWQEIATYFSNQEREEEDSSAIGSKPS